MTLREDARHGARDGGRVALVGATVSPWGTAESTVALRGRETEIGRLQEFVTGLATSGSGLLLVGEVGVGKSRLLERTAEIATAAGYRVLTAGGSRSEAQIEFAGLHQLMLPLTDAVARLRDPSRHALLAALGLESGSPGGEEQVFEAVFAALSSEAAERPVLVLIDDLQDLDSSTASAVDFLGRRLGSTRRGSMRTGSARIGLLAASVADSTLGTVTDDRPEREMGHSARRAFAGELEVPRLNRAASEQIVAAIAPTLSARARGLIADRAEGNPLALVQFARGSRDALGSDPGTPPAPASPPGTDAFAARIAGLPDETRRALLLLSLQGGTDAAVLASAGLGRGAVGPAEHAGLVWVDARGLTVGFRHPLIPSAVVAQATSAQRRQAHRLLAARTVDDLEKRAYHLSEASEQAEESTAALLERAAGVALHSGDTDSAMRYLARAAVVSPTADEQQRRLARATFVATGILGDREMATRLLSDSRLMRDGPGSLYTAVASALEQLMIGADSASAHRILRNAVEYGSHDWDADNEALIEALNTWLLVCWNAGRADYWRSFLSALQRMRPEAPEPLRTLSVAFADTARATTRERDTVVRLFTELGGRTDYTLVLQLNTAALFLDLLPLGEAATWTLIEAGRRGGPTVTYLRALGQMCLHDFGAGRWDEARALAAEGLEVASVADSLQIEAIFVYTQGLMAAVRGEGDESSLWIERLDAMTVPVDARGIQRFGAHARVLAAAAAADWERAYRDAAAVSTPGEFAPFVPIALWVAYDLVEAAMHIGRVTEARAHYDAMLAERLSELSPRLALLTAGAGAMIAGSAEWQRRYEQTLAIPHAREWPFDYARVQLAFGTRLGEERHPERARALLREALEAFERLGADPWATRARDAMRAAETRDDRVGSGLTAQERVVAELAAEGLSNRQIGERLALSTRTVSGHLYRIFPKLGITHRSGLRDALQSRE